MRRTLHLALLRLFRVLPRRVRLWVVHTLSPTFTVGAICVVERSDGAVLLVRHSYRRRWGFPGGLLKKGEEVADGARREALEETGLRVEIVEVRWAPRAELPELQHEASGGLVALARTLGPAGSHRR